MISLAETVLRVSKENRRKLSGDQRLQPSGDVDWPQPPRPDSAIRTWIGPDHTSYQRVPVSGEELENDEVKDHKNRKFPNNDPRRILAPEQNITDTILSTLLPVYDYQPETQLNVGEEDDDLLFAAAKKTKAKKKSKEDWSEPEWVKEYTPLPVKGKHVRIWHFTDAKNSESILKSGIKPGNRTGIQVPGFISAIVPEYGTGAAVEILEFTSGGGNVAVFEAMVPHSVCHPDLDTFNDLIYDTAIRKKVVSALQKAGASSKKIDEYLVMLGHAHTALPTKYVKAIIIALKGDWATGVANSIESALTIKGKIPPGSLQLVFAGKSTAALPRALNQAMKKATTAGIGLPDARHINKVTSDWTKTRSQSPGSGWRPGPPRRGSSQNQLPGGLGDEKTPTDVDPQQLAKGIKVEMEHTDDPKIAREIAIDHLTEISDYYDRLSQMGSRVGSIAEVMLNASDSRTYPYPEEERKRFKPRPGFGKIHDDVTHADDVVLSEDVEAGTADPAYPDVPSENPAAWKKRKTLRVEDAGKDQPILTNWETMGRKGDTETPLDLAERMRQSLGLDPNDFALWCQDANIRWNTRYAQLLDNWWGRFLGAEVADIGDIHTHKDGSKWEKQKHGNWIRVEHRDRKRRSPGSHLHPEIQDRLRDLGIKKLPPTAVNADDVVLNLDGPDVNRRAVISWKDSKGRWQSAYTPEFHAANAVKKWKRVEGFRKKVPNIKKRLDEMITNGEFGSMQHQAALMTAIIAETGLRPGSELSLRTTTNRGVSTLHPSDVSFDSNSATLSFVGKSGKTNTSVVNNPVLIKALKQYVDEDSSKSRIFNPNILKYTRKLVPRGMKLKDFRTIRAAETAAIGLKAILKPPPFTGNAAKDKRLLVQAINSVSKQVADGLNNTTQVARASYIPPQVFEDWARQIGIDEDLWNSIMDPQTRTSNIVLASANKDLPESIRLDHGDYDDDGHLDVEWYPIPTGLIEDSQRLRAQLREAGMADTRKLLKLIEQKPTNRSAKSRLIKDLEAFYLRAKKAYYNESPIVTDVLFDQLEDRIKELVPKSKVLKQTGAPVTRGNRKKVQHQYFMGSLDKIKGDDKTLERWESKHRGPYVVSDKVDGISLVIHYRKGKAPRVITRGDGRIGIDVSHLYPHFKGVPRRAITKDLDIRGEALVPVAVFKGKYAKDFANPRNFAGGIINSIEVDVTAAKTINFVAYRELSSKRPISEQLQNLKQLGFQVVWWKELATISSNELGNLLQDRKRKSKFEMDGLVVEENRSHTLPNSGNPSWAAAFKMTSEDAISEATVVGVEWNVSKDGYLKPRVKIKPVQLSGVKVTWATGHNFKFINDNKIGEGAVIRITRSGEVIPYILGVIKPARKADLPTEDYELTETGVDAVLREVESHSGVKLKRMISFFSTMGVENFSSGNIQKFVDGGLDTVEAILWADLDEMEAIPGIGPKMAEKIWDSIDAACDEAYLPTVMTASGIFGRTFGETRFGLIYSNYPDILKWGKLKTYAISDKIAGLSGFSESSATAFATKLPIFIKWLKETPITIVKPLKKATTGSLKGERVVFTGFRDKELAEAVKQQAGEYSDSLTKATTILVYDPDGKPGSKKEKAEQMGIRVMTVDAFKRKYKL